MSDKICTKCFRPFAATLDNFYKHKGTRDGLGSWCRGCVSKRAKIYQKAHPKDAASLREYTRKRRETHPGEEQRHRLTRYRRYRDELFDHYGKGDPKCECCGEHRREFLAFDHINNGGCAHRRSVGTGFAWLQHLRKNKPKDIRLLCHNCNMGRSGNGECPHKAPIKAVTSQVLLKESILDHYSGGTARCACCRMSGYRFLAIDHINGDGPADRKKIGQGPVFWRWIIRNNYPDHLRVLCHNCNSARGYYGKCPHETERELASI